MISAAAYLRTEFVTAHSDAFVAREGFVTDRAFCVVVLGVILRKLILCLFQVPADTVNRKPTTYHTTTNFAFNWIGST